MSTADAVLTAHVTALGRELRGPVRMRRSMLAETRDGLDDAAAALHESGLPARAAAERAVREFGPVAAVTPDYQAELTAAQSRHTALFAALVFPALLLGWDLPWSHGVAWTGGPPPALVLAMARLQDAASGIVTTLAVVVFVATWRRAVTPRLLAGGAAAVALAGGTVCGGAAVVMNVANGPDTVRMLTTNPVALPAMALSGLALLAILTTSARAFSVATRT